MVAGTVATANDPAAVMLGKPAPSFSLNEVRTGETHSLEDFRGKFVVLHFGASW
jgi:peroxiredoxin